MKPMPPHAATPRRTTDWNADRIAGLTTADVSQLRLNAERLNNAEIVMRCDEILGRRKAQEKAARAAARKSAA